MDAPKIERELHSSVADHQILFSFTNDIDARAFEWWWNEQGERMFKRAAPDYVEEE